MKGRIFTALLVLSMVVLVASYGLAADKVRFSVHIKANPLYVLPVLAAQEKGFFEGQGLEVEYIPFNSGPSQHRAVAAGAVDMGLGGLLSTIRVVARGGAERIVADTGTVDNWSLWVLTNSPLREPKDLRGAKISITRMGSLTDALARAVPRSLGMEKDVTIVATGRTPVRIAALKSGATEVTVAPYSTMAPLKVRGEVREFINVGKYVPDAVFSQIIFAHQDFIKSNPDVVRRTIRAFMQGASFVLKNKEWAINKLMTVQDFNYTRGIAEASYAQFGYDTEGRKIAKKDIQIVINWLLENKLLRTKKPLSSENFTVPGFSR